MPKLKDFDVTTIFFGFDHDEDGLIRRKIFQKVFYPKNCTQEEKATIVQESVPDMLKIINELAGKQPMIVQGQYTTLNLVYGEECPYCNSKLKASYPMEMWCRFCGITGLECCFNKHECDKTKVRYWKTQHRIEKIPDDLVDREINRYLLRRCECNELNEGV